jgi:hypothetical protein
LAEVIVVALKSFAAARPSQAGRLAAQAAPLARRQRTNGLNRFMPCIFAHANAAASAF